MSKLWRFVDSVRLEILFVVLSLFFGLIYVVVTPPFQSVDENFHFLRSYSVGNFDFVTKVQDGQVGSNLPVSLIVLTDNWQGLIKNIDKKVSPADLKTSADIKLEKNNQAFANFPNTALYSPASYIAQGIGVGISEALNVNPFYSIYLARFLNLLLWTLLGYLSIKIIPAYKLLTFIFLLFPMNLSIGASMSSDVVLIGLNVLLFAFILRSVYEDKVKNLNLFYIVLCLSILALSKHSIFLIPLIFLISPKKFDSKIQYSIFISSALFIPISLCFLWTAMIKDLYTPLNSQANMYEQMNFIMSNPLQYVWILVVSTIVKLGRLIITGIGVLGWQDVRLDFLTYILIPICVWLSLKVEDMKIVFTKFQKTILVLTIFLTYIIISTYMYLSWSPIGAKIITGMNGKYFAPIFLPLMVGLSFMVKNKYSLELSNNIKIFCVISTAFVLLSSVLSICLRFYNILPNLYYQV